MGLWTRTTTSLLHLLLPNPKGPKAFLRWSLGNSGFGGGGFLLLRKQIPLHRHMNRAHDQRTLLCLQSMLRQEELRQQERDAQRPRHHRPVSGI